MFRESRAERLAAELQAMRALQRTSSILEFACSSGFPEQYRIVFQGPVLRQRPASAAVIDPAGQHRLEILLTSRYPDRAPDIRWLSPIFHPNVAAGGFVSLPHIGLDWQSDLGLDVICERLWDVARLQYVNLRSAPNPAARAYFRANHYLSLPIDPRPLRDLLQPVEIQFFNYRERIGPPPVARRPECVKERLFIGDSPPVPQQPPSRREDEVLYIGDW